jgi:hypothetical protein
MERTYLDDAVLISVLDNISSEKKCDILFLCGKVINDRTNRFQIGKFLITTELEMCSKDVFLTKNGDLFETSDPPNITTVSCSEFLLMRINSFQFEQILSIRECRDKSKLISAFDN